MKEETILWIIGIVVSNAIAVVTVYVNLVQRITKLEAKFEMFILALGNKAARALHSPDDHLGLDSLLDKYLSHHYDLSLEEWIELAGKCNIIVGDTNGTKTESSLAGILAAVCEHKLHGFPLELINKLKK